jgi:hypothetical protein
LILDLSLSNEALYAGLSIEHLAGKPTLLTPPAEALPVLVANLAIMEIDSQEVVLTGSMAIWAYLVAFHSLHGRTKRIFYEDGRRTRVLVAAHG